jgi:hypothetical protein
MPEEVNDVLQVTALTPSTPVEGTVPAAPTAPQMPEARPVEQPAATEEVPQDTTAQAPAAPAEEGEGVSHETPPAKKPSRGVQKALDRLTAEREEARQQASAATAALAAVVMQNQQRQAPRVAPPQVDQAPKRENFNDWEAFNRAVTQYESRNTSRQEVRQELGNFLRTIANEQNQQAIAQEANRLARKVMDSNAKAPERFPDWEDAVVASDVPMPRSLAHAITLSDDPALVMHHLGIHPEEHERVNQMSPAEQLLYVGKVTASAPQAAISKAPPPAKPIGGGKSQATPQYSENMTPDQHRAWMAKQGLTRGLR